jgi:hypothetical protein
MPSSDQERDHDRAEVGAISGYQHSHHQIPPIWWRYELAKKQTSYWYPPDDDWSRFT